MRDRRNLTGDPGAQRLPRTIIAGFVATVAMTLTLVVAYWIASELGDPNPPAYAARPGPPQWMWALTHNPITELTRGALPAAFGLHLAFGLIWAAIYTYVFEPRLPGRDWQRGALFSLVPWILSLIVFLPVAGGGLFGLELGAGPLPTIGNLILHLVYGVTLGELYGRLGSAVLTETGFEEDTDEEVALASAERSAAIGILAGSVAGGLVGGLGGYLFHGSFGAPIPGSASGVVLGLFWALLGGSVGALVGSLMGLSRRASDGRRV
ncbi:MAG TPA: DUF6789 family protein [Thermodesulfobacteriota bacterium]|nr:DUF6789 family protein [Thermodesulfobacteriota bacterium]